jgi:hypothetical protein
MAMATITGTAITDTRTTAVSLTPPRRAGIRATSL